MRTDYKQLVTLSGVARCYPMKTIIPRARLGRLPTIGNIAPTLVFVSFTTKKTPLKKRRFDFNTD